MYYLSHLQLFVIYLLLLSSSLIQSRNVKYNVSETCDKSTSYLSKSEFLIFPGTVYDKTTGLGYAADTTNVVSGFFKDNKITTVTFDGNIRSGITDYNIEKSVCDAIPHENQAMFIVLCNEYEVYYHRKDCMDVHIMSPMPNITGFFFCDNELHWHWRCVTATEPFHPPSCRQTQPPESDIYFQKRPKQDVVKVYQHRQVKTRNTRKTEYSYKKQPMKMGSTANRRRQLLQITEASNLTCVQDEYWTGKTCAPCPLGFFNDKIFHRALFCDKHERDATLIVVFVGLGSLNIFISLVIISFKHIHQIQKYKFF